MKIPKKNIFLGGVGQVGGGQGRCELRREVFVKIKKKLGGVRSGWVGGQVRCERRIEVFVKIKKKNLGGGGVGSGGGGEVGSGGAAGLVEGVRVDVNEELKFF